MLFTPPLFLRDSDDEAEGKVPAAAKKPLETIVNEVEAMGEEVTPAFQLLEHQMVRVGGQI